MSKIPLGGKHGTGKFALVDEEDLPSLKMRKWYVLGGYAATKCRDRGVLMHVAILWYPKGKGLEIDHINRNKLDNRRKNLRVVPRSINELNKPVAKNNRSGFTGVSWCKSVGKWRAQIGSRENLQHLGLFTSKKKAIAAYKKAKKDRVAKLSTLQ